MRYREDAVTGDIGAPVVNDGMMVGTALYALLAGIGICLIGIRSRLIWATLMGGSLAGLSVVYLGAVVLGYA
jgi:hypothetical protein